MKTKSAFDEISIKTALRMLLLSFFALGSIIAEGSPKLWKHTPGLRSLMAIVTQI